MTAVPEIKLPKRVVIVDRMDTLLGPLAAYATIDVRGGMTFRSHERLGGSSFACHLDRWYQVTHQLRVCQ